MNFYFNLDDLDLKQLTERFTQTPSEEEATLYYQELAYLISEQGKEGITFLKKQRPKILIRTCEKRHKQPLKFCLVKIDE